MVRIIIESARDAEAGGEPEIEGIVNALLLVVPYMWDDVTVELFYDQT